MQDSRLKDPGIHNSIDHEHSAKTKAMIPRVPGGRRRTSYYNKQRAVTKDADDTDADEPADTQCAADPPADAQFLLRRAYANHNYPVIVVVRCDKYDYACPGNSSGRGGSYFENMAAIFSAAQTTSECTS